MPARRGRARGGERVGGDARRGALVLDMCRRLDGSAQMAERQSRLARSAGDGTLGDVTGLDWIIVGLMLLLALFGWAQGFVSGVLALSGSPSGPSSAPGSGRWCCPRAPVPVRAALRAARRAVRRRRAGRAVRGVRQRVAARARALPGVAAPTALLGAMLIACAGSASSGSSAPSRSRAARPSCATEVQRSAILQRLNNALRPRDRCSTRCGGSTRSRSRRAGGDVDAAARASRATRRCARRRAAS